MLKAARTTSRAKAISGRGALVIRLDETVGIGWDCIDAENQQDREGFCEMSHHGMSPEARKIPAKRKWLSQGRL